MGLEHKRLGKTARISLAIALVLGLASTTFSVAFGDFVPVTEAKTLGVGRIQSTLPESSVAPEEKFALASTENTAEQATELAEPIAREVAPVEAVEPVQDPQPQADDPATTDTQSTASDASADNSSADTSTNATPQDAGWVSTIATNYGTPYDGFLGKMTASGTITTTTSMGVAHKNLPLGTQLELYCPSTGLSCVVTVDDRGPYDGRPDTFDFQMGVTAALGNNTGWYQVQYRIL